LSLELSAGSGYRLSPDSGRIPTNVMAAPGIAIVPDVLRLEVGLLGDFADVSNARFDLQVRPMLLITAPAFPIYGRVIAGVTQLLHGPVAVAFGGAVGLRGGLDDGVAVFAEVGYVPRVDRDHIESVVEGRVGLMFGS
jgi:hypothetical protein